MSKSKKFLSIGLLLGIVSVLGILWGISSAEASQTLKPKSSPSLYFDGSAYGLDANDVDGINLTLS